MKKFRKEQEEEMRLDKKIAKKEKKQNMRDTKIALDKSRSQLKKLSRANNGFDKLKGKLDRELSVIRTRLKMTNKQLKLLSKKEEFLLKEKSNIDGYKKGNQMQISIEKKEVQRLKHKLY